jgi:hypothetical protein
MPAEITIPLLILFVGFFVRLLYRDMKQNDELLRRQGVSAYFSVMREIQEIERNKPPSRCSMEQIYSPGNPELFIKGAPFCCGECHNRKLGCVAVSAEKEMNR